MVYILSGGWEQRRQSELSEIGVYGLPHCVSMFVFFRRSQLLEDILDAHTLPTILATITHNNACSNCFRLNCSIDKYPPFPSKSITEKYDTYYYSFGSVFRSLISISDRFTRWHTLTSTAFTRPPVTTESTTTWWTWRSPSSFSNCAWDASRLDPCECPWTICFAGICLISSYRSRKCWKAC